MKKLVENIKLFFCSNSLDEIAKLTGGDKKYGHDYIPIYENHFKHLRNKKLKLLEIGVGGYEDKHSGGESLRMWAHFFKKSSIYGLDINEKDLNVPHNVTILKGDQSNSNEIERIARTKGMFDIIIDDGSHKPKDVIKTFEVLFKHLNEKGIYVIEDTQTSYWPDFGGTLKDTDSRATKYFKDKTDGLNHSEYLIKNYEPSNFDKFITSIHFYHNIIFVKKGRNNNKSLFVKDGVLNL